MFFLFVVVDADEENFAVVMVEGVEIFFALDLGYGAAGGFV